MQSPTSNEVICGSASVSSDREAENPLFRYVDSSRIAFKQIHYLTEWNEGLLRHCPSQKTGNSTIRQMGLNFNGSRKQQAQPKARYAQLERQREGIIHRGRIIHKKREEAKPGTREGKDIDRSPIDPEQPRRPGRDRSARAKEGGGVLVYRHRHQEK